MDVQQRYYSADDLWDLSKLPEYKDRRLELIEGVLVDMMAAASRPHGKVTAKAVLLIGNFVEAHQLGEVTTGEGAYIMHKDPEGRDTILVPDVAFVAAGRLPPGTPDSGYTPLAPDLAVEVVSPNDTASEVEEKVALYLQYGTRMVLVLYPKKRRAMLHTPSGAQHIDQDGEFVGGDVLPDFRVAIREFFSVLD